MSNVASADEFECKDPVNGSISKHQGIWYLFEDGSCLVSVVWLFNFILMLNMKSDKGVVVVSLYLFLIYKPNVKKILECR